MTSYIVMQVPVLDNVRALLWALKHTLKVQKW